MSNIVRYSHFNFSSSPGRIAINVSRNKLLPFIPFATVIHLLVYFDMSSGEKNTGEFQ